MPVIISPDRRAGRPPRRRGRRRPGRRRPGHGDGPQLVRQQADRGGRRRQPADLLPGVLVRQPRPASSSASTGPSGPAPSGSSSRSTGRSSTAATGAARTSPSSSTSRRRCSFAPEVAAPAAVARHLAEDQADPRPRACRTWRCRASRRRRSSAPTASGWAPRRRRGRTSPGCASSGTGRSWSRASCASTTPAGPSTSAPPPSRCRTTAATTSTRTPASIRALPVDRRGVGDQIELVLDSGIRRGSDVVKAVALGAKAVMIGRAYLWGLAANGQAGVENVLDILRNGIDSALRGARPRRARRPLPRRRHRPRRLRPPPRRRGLRPGPTMRTPPAPRRRGLAGGRRRWPPTACSSCRSGPPSSTARTSR